MKNKYYAIFGVLFLLLSLGGAIYLSFQNADTRNKATGLRDCTKEDVGETNWAARCTTLGATKCQIGKDGNNTGYQCKCLDLSPGTCNFYANNCDTFDSKACSTDKVPAPKTLCTEKQAKFDGICVSRGTDVTTFNATLVQCPGEFPANGCGSTKVIRESSSSLCFDKTFCGAQQIDVYSSAGDCWFHLESNDCITPTKPASTNTPTPTRINTPSPTPTGTVVTPTPTNTNTPTPTGTVVTPTPTNTSAPTNTPTPPVISYLSCGYTPCDSTGKICNSGLTCITANNSNQYCSKPELTKQCKVNPGYEGCCTVPNTQGPSPTRIVLPVSGVNFPVQALTIVGVITTLLGFLILL